LLAACKETFLVLVGDSDLGSSLNISRSRLLVACFVLLTCFFCYESFVFLNELFIMLATFEFVGADFTMMSNKIYFKSKI